MIIVLHSISKMVLLFVLCYNSSAHVSFRSVNPICGVKVLVLTEAARETRELHFNIITHLIYEICLYYIIIII